MFNATSFVTPIFFSSQANQIRRTKREEILSKKRSIGGERSPPHYVVRLHYCLQQLVFTSIVITGHEKPGTDSVIEFNDSCLSDCYRFE